MTIRGSRSAPSSLIASRRRAAAWWVAACLLAARGTALGQTLPGGPVTTLDGRLSIGAEIVATVGDEDDVAFFNYTDYEHNVLRMVRIALSAAWRPVERVALVAEVRAEDFNTVRPYAAYVRVRPWQSIGLDIQAGRIPPSFGSFGRRTYYADNPLIGYPLAYQYLTSLRADAVPATMDDLLRMRGRGWQLTYPVGSPEPAPGVPLVSGFRWDTGVQAHWTARSFELTGSLTVGTLSDPHLPDNNDGKQLSARAAVRPTVGLVLGSSVARGDWLSNDVKRLLPDPDRSYAQTSFGADAEYSRDHWLVRGELVWSRFDVPLAATTAVEDLDSLGMWVEGRYRLAPRITIAGRADRLGFSHVVRNDVRIEWDAPVDRVEADLSYYLQRNLVARFAVQHASRDGGRVRSRTYFAGQLAYWF